VDDLILPPDLGVEHILAKSGLRSSDAANLM
jgi:hypothetical protein